MTVVVVYRLQLGLGRSVFYGSRPNRFAVAQTELVGPQCDDIWPYPEANTRTLSRDVYIAPCCRACRPATPDSSRRGDVVPSNPTPPAALESLCSGPRPQKHVTPWICRCNGCHESPMHITFASARKMHPGTGCVPNPNPNPNPNPSQP